VRETKHEQREQNRQKERAKPAPPEGLRPVRQNNSREAASHRFSGGQLYSLEPAKRRLIASAGDKL